MPRGILRTPAGVQLRDMSLWVSRAPAFLALVLILVLAGGRADAEVTGRVLSPDGRPVGGAVVAALAPETTDARSPRLVQGKERPTAATATTGIDGSFRLAAADGVVAIGARRDGFAPAVALAQSGAPLTLTLRPAPTRRGRVTAAGRPVANALVVLLSSSTFEEPAELVTRSDADGRYEVPEPARWAEQIVVVHEAFALLAVGPGSAGAWAKALNPQLAPGVALEGRVIDAKGRGGLGGLAIWVDGWPRG